MLQLGILLIKHHRLLSVAAMLDVFESANRFLEQQGKPAYFQLHLLYPTMSRPPAFTDHPVHTLADSPPLQLILIPSFGVADIGQAVKLNTEAVGWLQQQRRAGAEIASVCTGSFLLAATGLLDQKPATTHIQAANIFARAYPKVQVKAGEVMTVRDGIYTGGGATNSFYLLLSLVEKYCGRELALSTAKYFGIDMDRDQQAYFGTFIPVQNHKDELVGELQRRIQVSFKEAGTIEELLTEIPASRRNLSRRFKEATGYTPIEYLQRTRIEVAKRILEQTDGTILEVMLEAGYNDLKAFRQLFRKNTGMTPTEYRGKFYRKKEIELA
ncbi:MAG: helix-turn-helix domain-containing protein [Candidatus Pseudobacter hemicellulosilyticus]|uniref:Helix-turn-helix domain-containing protein n=1 Tax=Candidatus Pseudobacter hemicellulosilyticus TaxID=3121375 RepID=A0AAJ5WS54_9BACT|nr:MAG: helix-turn-helix domain-containing protein [Pseudobacter sp.]